jgi:sulfur-oxidizing protein SoxY
MKRRRFVQGAAALAIVGVRPVHAALPAMPSLDKWLAGRTPRFERIKLSIPAIADNGFAVPIRVSVDGPFSPGLYVKSIRLFSETNPVPDMAVFEFPVPIDRVEIESRVRLAGTQQVVVAAEMTDGRVYAISTEVIVTLAGCMDGT